MPGHHDEKTPLRPSFSDRLRHAGSLVAHHAKRHTGVGIVCAVAYFDPWVETVCAGKVADILVWTVETGASTYKLDPSLDTVCCS